MKYSGGTFGRTNLRRHPLQFIVSKILTYSELKEMRYDELKYIDDEIPV